MARNPKMLTKIPENAMNSFMAEIRRRKIDLREFRVSFFELSDFYSVLLRYKDTPLLELDSDKYPSYQVRLSLDTGELISVGKPLCRDLRHVKEELLGEEDSGTDVQ